MQSTEFLARDILVKSEVNKRGISNPLTFKNNLAYKSLLTEISKAANSIFCLVFQRTSAKPVASPVPASRTAPGDISSKSLAIFCPDLLFISLICSELL